MTSSLGHFLKLVHCFLQRTGGVDRRSVQRRFPRLPLSGCPWWVPLCHFGLVVCYIVAPVERVGQPCSFWKSPVFPPIPYWLGKLLGSNPDKNGSIVNHEQLLQCWGFWWVLRVSAKQICAKMVQCYGCSQLTVRGRWFGDTFLFGHIVW